PRRGFEINMLSWSALCGLLSLLLFVTWRRSRRLVGRQRATAPPAAESRTASIISATIVGVFLTGMLAALVIYHWQTNTLNGHWPTDLGLGVLAYISFGLFLVWLFQTQPSRFEADAGGPKSAEARPPRSSWLRATAMGLGLVLLAGIICGGAVVMFLSMGDDKDRVSSLT